MKRMAKQKRKINVIVTFSEGWQERFTKAAYELWLKCKMDEAKVLQEEGGKYERIANL